jgi:hypothetical protein
MNQLKLLNVKVESRNPDATLPAPAASPSAPAAVPKAATP